MSEWTITPPIKAAIVHRQFRCDFTEDAHAEITLGKTLLGLHIYYWFEQPVTEDLDRRELVKALIEKTREALAAMEASLEELAKPVDFPAEVDPVGAIERR